jgi:hypothetical protein
MHGAGGLLKVNRAGVGTPFSAITSPETTVAT